MTKEEMLNDTFKSDTITLIVTLLSVTGLFISNFFV